MFKKSQKSTFERYEKETGKPALTKDNKITKAFGDWSVEADNCTAIPQSVDKKFLDEKYPKYLDKSISKEVAVEEYSKTTDEIKKLGICVAKGNHKRLKGLRDFAEDRKSMYKELGL